MSAILLLNDRPTYEENLLTRLTSYQMMPQLLKETAIDAAIESISYTEDELDNARKQFYDDNQFSELELQVWLKRHNMDLNFLETIFIPRLLKIEKFKHQTWNHKLQSYFLKCKQSLDCVIYSMIRVDNAEIANELYFRIQEGEQSFAELAHQYSQGAEAHIGGTIGPVELGTVHSELARLLSISQPGQLWHPILIQEWFLIVRLEKLIPATLNISMRQRLLRELFESWVQEQVLMSCSSSDR